MSNSNAHCCDNSQVRSAIYDLLVHRLHWLILGSPRFEPLWLWVAASEPHYRILIDRNQPVSMLRKGRDFRACGCRVCFTWYGRHLRAITGSVKCEFIKKLKKSLLLVCFSYKIGLHHILNSFSTRVWPRFCRQFPLSL